MLLMPLPRLQFEELRRDNVLDFIAYGFWYTSRASMAPPAAARVESVLADLEATFGVRIPEGYNPGLQFMAHLWQPLRVLHKPLAVHVGSEVLAVVSHASLQALGFRRYAVRGAAYWVRGLGPPVAMAAGGDECDGDDGDEEQVCSLQACCLGFG